MKTGLVLGFFDGVHLAHQEVIRSAINYAEKADFQKVMDCYNFRL